jgi:uncharacterized protein (DUF427 family)
MAPGHTIVIAPASRHIDVSVRGQTLAASDRAVRLDESGRPARYYFPREEDRRTYVLLHRAGRTDHQLVLRR